MKNTKEKKIILPNECSLLRWILVLGISLIAVCFMLPFQEYANNSTDTLMGIKYVDLYNTLSFVPMYIGFVVAMRLIAKTSVKDFVLGVNGKLNKKLSLTILGLYALGMAAVYLCNIKNLSWRGVQPGQYVFLVVLMLLVLWMQTTVEEYMFRGIILRWLCKNEIGYNKKAIIGAVITSLLFAVSHITNPEVASQSGFDIVIITSGYFLYGFVCFWADIHFGSLLPGIIMHWCNNFIIATLVTQEVSALTYPTLWIDHTPKVASWDLITICLANLPVIIFMVVDLIKRKKAVSSDNT